ncbi:MAG: polysaccharide biosynthesis protein [Bacteroidales bacterium]|nr:polysaccharide biosynthesis protein [Bacteroidales bacterium]
MNITKLLARILSRLEKRNTPRWIILIIDLTISFISIILAFQLRFNFKIPEDYYQRLYYIIPMVFFIRGFFFLIYRVYAHIVRYTGLLDVKRIFITVLSGSGVFVILNLAGHYYNSKYLIPLSVILIEFLITAYLMTNLRMFIKYLFMRVTFSEKDTKNVIIYGTKELAVLTKNALELDPKNNYKIVAFLENATKITKQKLIGTTIYSIKDFEEILSRSNVTHLIFAKQNIDPYDKDRIAKKCIKHNIKMMTIPDIHNWINNELKTSLLREVNIEDLLEREPINLDKQHIKNYLSGKVILITGAAGSIGSEIVRQVANYKPKNIILVDQAESPLYDIELELIEKYGFKDFEVVLCDILNKQRLDKLFGIIKPEVVYHAAAYKHVPMMENNPIEAFQNNVVGTRILADLSVKHNVRTFVMVSTDKAVNPTGIMGATKRIAEMYTQSMNDVYNTNFITTRFGNVLGSNGSVIPRFMKQIKEGGPITITHPEITRYFMTIPEACQLVLEASVLGKGGEIFLFDMGKAIKILDLAKNMIRLSGKLIEKDIKIKFTGLRPGEKLYEELLLASENNKPTHHPKIMVAEVCKYHFDDIRNRLDSFSEPLKNHNLLSIVRLMKDMVPTYKSKNSTFEKLDTAV